MLGWIKEHPYLSGGLALGIVVLFVLFKNASSSSAQASQTSSSGPSDAVTVAGLQANTALEQMAYAAQTQVAGFNAAVNNTALQTAAQTSIANNQTAGAVQLGLAQTDAQVAVASIAAGGIAPFSVNGTPGYNAGIVGHSLVQSQAAADAAVQNSQIANTSATIANAATAGTPIPTTTPVTLPSGNTVAYTPSTPTSIGTGIAPGLPSPAGFATESDYVAAVDATRGFNSQTAGLVGDKGFGSPTVQMLGNEAAAAWSSYYGPGGTLIQEQAAQNAALNQHAA